MGSPWSQVLARSLVFAGIGALSACSGGSSLGVPAQGAASQQSLARSTQSTKHDVSPNPYPTGTGTTFDYSYTLVLSNSPGTTSQLFGTIAETIGSATTFNGNPVVDYNSVLNYASRVGARVNGTTTTDDYDNFTPSNFYYYGHKQSGSELDGSSTTVTSNNTQTYGAPFILDILPEARGNNALEPLNYTLTASNSSSANGGTSSTESYSQNADGSSTTSETFTSPTGTYPYSKTINPDASASETNGIPGQPTSGSTTFSAPSGGTITVVYTPTSGSPVTTHPTAWYAGFITNMNNSVLESDKFKQVASAQAVPARCNSIYSGTPSVHIREVLNYFDPVAGSTDSETIDRFVVSGAGVACLINTRLVSYYDNRTTGNPVGTTSVSVIEGLTSETPAQRQIAGFGPIGSGLNKVQMPIGLKIDRSLLGH